MDLEIINYLNMSFRPVKLTTSVKDLKKLNYVNPFYSVIAETIDNIISIKFTSSYFMDSNEVQIYKKSEFLSLFRKLCCARDNNIIFSNYITEFSFFLLRKLKIYKIKHEYTFNLIGKNEDDIVEFDSLGDIPNRWMRMLYDFSNSKFISFTEYDKILSTPNDLINKKINDIDIQKIILEYSEILNRYIFNVKIYKGPKI